MSELTREEREAVALTADERQKVVDALYDFPHAGVKWLKFRDGVWAVIERIVAAREQAAYERGAADVRGELAGHE